MALNLYWLKRVCEFAKDNHRIPIFWDDMPLQHAKLYESTWSDEVTADEAKSLWQKGVGVLDSLQQDFPKNCVYMRWNYSMANQPGNIMALDWYEKNKLQAMVATATNAEGGMLFQEDQRTAEKPGAGIIFIKSFIELAAQKKISGMLCTAWDDKSPHMENYWRGFIAAAEYSWHPAGRQLAEFDEVWAQKEFGLNIKDYGAINATLRTGSVLWYEALFKNGQLLDDENGLQSMKQVEHWLKPLADQEKKQFDYSTKLIDLPNPKNIGEFSRKYQDKLNRSAIELNKQPTVSKMLTDLENKATRNKYYWLLSSAIYRFQLATPALLIALQQCDVADEAKRKAGLTAVEKAVDELHASWLNLNQAYSVTRFITLPPDFVKDRYFHLASQREDLSWMIQAQELFEQKILTWMKNIQ
jgi:hexosaminidase